MKTYRILVIVRHPVGGIRTFFRYVYRNFRQRSYRFTMVAPDLPETRVLLEDLRELDLKYVAADANVSNRELCSLVTKTIHTETFDLIHSHGFTSGACSVLGALCKRTPHIITCHDVFSQGQFRGLKGLVRKVGLGIMLSCSDFIHCVSDDARDNLLAYLPILRPFDRKIIAIRNGIEMDTFLNAERRDLRAELGLPRNTFLIGFLGRFMSQKGFRYLLDALELIEKDKNLPKKALLLAFSGEDGFIREEKENVKIRGLTKSVLFLPFVPHVASTLKGLDIVAMPSLWEACGLLGMEVMTAGVPLVGTDCVGLREVLRNTPAYVVPAGNGLALSRALIEEIKNPTKRKAQQFAAEAGRRFQVQERARELESLIGKCLER